jgi:hypothetical protein
MEGTRASGAQAVYAVESSLRLRLRRYGLHVGRTARRGTGDLMASKGDGAAEAKGRSADRHHRAYEPIQSDRRIHDL